MRYRVKAEHPRRPGQPLRVTAKDGTFLAASGDLCDHLPKAVIASMVANGFVEPVSESPEGGPRA